MIRNRLLGLLAVRRCSRRRCVVRPEKAVRLRRASVTRSEEDTLRLMGLHVFTADRLQARRWSALRSNL